MASPGKKLEENEQVLMERLAMAGNHSNSTALGITLAQSLTEAHGGRMMIISQGINTGSHFLVLLPMPASKKDIGSAHDAAKTMEVGCCPNSLPSFNAGGLY